MMLEVLRAGLCPHGLGKRTKRTGGSNAAYSQERAHPGSHDGRRSTDIIVSRLGDHRKHFSLPGLGQLLTNATTTRDYTVVSAVVLITSVVLVFINLITDLSYGFLDPRVHYQ